MKRFCFALALMSLLIPVVSGQEAPKQPQVKIRWQPLKIAQSRFPRSIGMMDAERDDYASNLAGVAIVQLLANKADKASSDVARRMMGLALHLSPRNKKAVVLNFQLGKGTVPPPPETDYRPQTLARLLMKRAQLLVKQEGEGNKELAGFMFQLAADLDPKSEDAIYLSELHRINHGEADWSKLLLNRE